MRWQRAILWYRNDLRIHDHEPLTLALDSVKELIPVYCIDPRWFGETSFSFAKTGPHRAQFLLESLTDLRHRLHSKGSELIIRWGKPEEVLPELARAFQAEGVFAHQEVTNEEKQVEEAVEHALFKTGITLELLWGASLYHLADLPMPVHALPDIYTQFRKQVEKMAEVRETFPTPEAIPTPAIPDPGEIPTLAALGLETPDHDPRAVLRYQGGETAGLERLNQYLWEQDLLKTYKETRNGLLGADYSSKFSAWLSMGCLSPRKVYEEVKRYESLRTKNSSTYWLIFELIWRDYFRFVAKRYGNRLFQSGGIKHDENPGKQDWKRFEAWAAGNTGIPFIDANMRELTLSGFMSNRGRQNVASFLVKDLGIDWRMGAEYFESFLVDYDPCSNWGNWNYVAGVGNDPREDRYFNIISQAKRYDPHGDYVRHWVPELASLPASLIHDPAHAYPNQLREHHIELGVTYPNPLVDLAKNAASRR
jgi:deoxyribodipyrimidine photo-lyase